MTKYPPTIYIHITELIISISMQRDPYMCPFAIATSRIFNKRTRVAKGRIAVDFGVDYQLDEHTRLKISDYDMTGVLLPGIFAATLIQE